METEPPQIKFFRIISFNHNVECIDVFGKKELSKFDFFIKLFIKIICFSETFATLYQ